MVPMSPMSPMAPVAPVAPILTTGKSGGNIWAEGPGEDWDTRWPPQFVGEVCSHPSHRISGMPVVGNTQVESLTGRIICSISTIIDSICARSEPCARFDCCFPTEGFGGTKDSSILEYLLRINAQVDFSPSCLVLMSSILFYELPTGEPKFKICKHNVHSLVFIASVLAYKMNEDVTFSNRYLSEVGNFPLEVLNKYELEMLRSLSWDLMSPTNDFQRMLYKLMELHESHLSICMCSGVTAEDELFCHEKFVHCNGS